MADFSYFIQPQGPTIPTTLFSDAATAGINAGNKLPSIGQSIIDGALKGLDKNSELQKEAAVTQYYEQQTQTAQLEAETQRLTQASEIELKNAEAKLKVQSAEQQLEVIKQQNADITLRSQLSSDLGSSDPYVRKGVFHDPKYTGIFLRDNKLAEEAFNSLNRRGDLTPEEQANIYKGIDFKKSEDLRLDQQKRDTEADKVLAEDYEKKLASIPKSVRGLLNGAPISDILNYEVAPKGVKQVLEDGVTINPAAADETAHPEEKNYEVFRGGKKLNTFLDKSDAEDLRAFQDTFKRRYGVNPVATQATATPQNTPVTNAPTAQAVPARSFDIPQDIMTQTQNAAQASAKNAGAFQKMYDSLPEFLQSNQVDATAASDINAPKSQQDLRNSIQTLAAKKTQETLTKLESGTPTEKETIRAWADANGIRLTPTSVRRYLEDKIRGELSTAYDEAYKTGAASKAAATQTDNATSAAQERNAAALVGSSPEEALRIAEVGNAKAQALGIKTPSVGEKAASVAKSNNLSSAQTKGVVDTAEKVAFHPNLEDKPSYVKAVAAVESRGNTYAKSATGVRGLMQVTSDVAGQYGLDRNKPEENVLAGQLYLEDLFRLFGGNRELAYAGYNAGPTVIKYAQKLAGGATDWESVKPFVYNALNHFYLKGDYPVRPEDKLKEVLSYPEKVSMYERIYTA